MRKLLSTLTLLLCLSALQCKGRSSVGTGVSNPPTVPAIPVASYVPEFEDNLPESALTPTADDSLSLRLLNARTLFLSGPAEDWTDLFGDDGPITQARAYREQLESFGETVFTTLQAQNFEVADELTDIALGSTLLMDLTEDRTLQIGWADSDQEYIRQVVRRTSDSDIRSYYLFTTTSEGIPTKGFLLYGNSDLFYAPETTGVRYFSLRFDFTDETQNLMVIRSEINNGADSNPVANEILYQCNQATQDCIGEYLEITAPESSRVLSDRSVRFSWNETTRNICIAATTYSDSGTEFGETQSFVGPNQPSESDVTTGICEIANPAWSGEVFSSSDLPIRIGESDIGASDFEVLYGNGLGLTTWEEQINTEVLEADIF